LPTDVISLLSEVPGELDPVASRRALLGRMLAALDADPGQGEAIARRLYSLARHGELSEIDFGWEPFALDDEFELARTMVYGTTDSATQRLRDYLRSYSQGTAV
jgi:hypothetical protein